MLITQLRQLPTFQVLCGAFLISFSGIFVKLADVSPTASGFYRVFFGAVFLFGATYWVKGFKKLTRAEWLLITFCGFVFALDLFFWHESIMYIGPGLATLLGNFQVFFLAAAGILFLGEKSRPRFFAALPLAILGLLLIVGIHWNTLTNNYKTGIYFGLLTAACYTAFLLSLRKIRSRDTHSLFSTLMIVSVTCAFFLGIKMLHAGDSFTIPNYKSLSALLGLGLFSQTVGWVLIAHALPKMRASHAGLILLLQPSLAFIWDVLLFNRPTDTLNWLGLLITLAAIYMGLTGKASRPPR
ncbi:DMT family transporter [Desulfopila sp. IMCC35006]|uniref:DMT family transporter n=1 Tax=Desulfopila sp. IMCC35006 TaxID=2569542 RepID=UPI0010AC6C65|nr:DMT family transporter [Desulfopila sp. IMCC35006]TKB27091.1 DMT family transporter [Desulfopila sp. IMCC35006]